MADRLAGSGLLRSRPPDGPLGRAAVVRYPSAGPDDLATRLTDELRRARCMAVEIDVARVDPFDDIDAQWHRAATQGSYDIVFSVGELLPPAVALGVAAGLTVAVVHEVPRRDLVPFLHGAGPTPHPVAVLDVVVDRVRRVTVDGLEVSADDPFTAGCRYGGGSMDTTTRRLLITSGDADRSLLVTGDGGAPITAERCEIPEQRGVVLRVGIDDRWCHARSVDVRALPEPLPVVQLGPRDPGDPRGR